MRRAVENMWLLGNPDIAADIAEAKRKVGEGYGFFKLKVGVKRVEDEIEAAQAGARRARRRREAVRRRQYRLDRAESAAISARR